MGPRTHSHGLSLPSSTPCQPTQVLPDPQIMESKCQVCMLVPIAPLDEETCSRLVKHAAGCVWAGHRGVVLVLCPVSSPCLSGAVLLCFPAAQPHSPAQASRTLPSLTAASPTAERCLCCVELPASPNQGVQSRTFLSDEPLESLSRHLTYL